MVVLGLFWFYYSNITNFSFTRFKQFVREKGKKFSKIKKWKSKKQSCVSTNFRKQRWFVVRKSVLSNRNGCSKVHYKPCGRIIFYGVDRGKSKTWINFVTSRLAFYHWLSIVKISYKSWSRVLVSNISKFCNSETLSNKKLSEPRIIV